MTTYQKLVLKALAQLLRGVSTVAFYKNEQVSDACAKVAWEIEDEIKE